MNIDKQIYIVLRQFESKIYIRERELSDSMNRQKLVNEIVSGELDDVVQVWEFNPFEKWSNDISADIAVEVAQRVKAMMALSVENEIPADVRRFVERWCGVGTVLQAAA